MSEKTLLLGKHRSIVAILHDPPTASSVPVAFVFLNGGIRHRVGSNRIYVTIARELAKCGFPSVRFDMSGIGDSEPRRDNLTYHQGRLLDTEEVMGYLEEKKAIQHFVLVGLCSGADCAFRVAHRDDRVVGAVMLDGYAYPTFKTRLRYFGGRLFRWQAWRAVFTRSAGLIHQGVARLIGRGGESETYVVDVPPREEAELMLGQLINRRVKLLFTYSGSLQPIYNYEAQFGEMYPSIDVDSVQVELWPDADHTFTLLSNQQRLVKTITDWASENFACSTLADNSYLQTTSQ